MLHGQAAVGPGLPAEAAYLYGAIREHPPVFLREMLCQQGGVLFRVRHGNVQTVRAFFAQLLGGYLLQKVSPA